ncbi:hypothetical protein L246_39210 [Salmonella enterica subsp. enterica serovar Worthington str. BCH-5715]|nr:hypothetical protein L246_39210 [Salmonella enterica subsp. enterica serovar Worthington str. BCH-5715]
MFIGLPCPKNNAGIHVKDMMLSLQERHFVNITIRFLHRGRTQITMMKIISYFEGQVRTAN